MPKHGSGFFVANQMGGDDAGGGSDPRLAEEESNQILQQFNYPGETLKLSSGFVPEAWRDLEGIMQTARQVMRMDPASVIELCNAAWRCKPASSDPDAPGARRGRGRRVEHHRHERGKPGTRPDRAVHAEARRYRAGRRSRLLQSVRFAEASRREDCRRAPIGDGDRMSISPSIC